MDDIPMKWGESSIHLKKTFGFGMKQKHIPNTYGGRINLNMKWTSQYGICLFRRLPWLCELWIPWDRSYATRAQPGHMALIYALSA
jgi:hypothetical protein